MKSINHRFMTLTLAGLLIAGAAGKALAATASFKAYDSNGDGSISMEEYQAHGGQAAAFRAGDDNHDNSLSPDEFVKASANSDRIKAGKYVDDAWITAKVKTMLLKDEGLKGLDVNVETHKGTVQLAGWVNQPMQASEAETITRGVEGVKAVRNDLQIKH
jgi:hyperosmotically inducible protein